MSAGKSPLELHILMNFRSIAEAARAMSVTIPTMRNWIFAKPSNFLKYAREWSAQTGANYYEIVEIVTLQESYILQAAESQEAGAKIKQKQ